MRQILICVGAVIGLAVSDAHWRGILSQAVWLAAIAYISFLCWSFVGRDRTFPKFSLRALCLLLGFIGCSLSLAQQRDTWRQVHAFPGHNPNIAMSPDGSMVATNQGTSIEIRETKSGKHLKTLQMPANEAATKAGTRWYHEFAFSEDNSLLLTAGWRDQTHLYDWKKGASIRSWNAGSLPRISRSGLRFAGNQPNGETRVYGVDRDEPLLTVEVNESFGPSYSHLSETGKYVVSATGKNMLEVWEVDTKTKCFTIPDTPMRSFLMLTCFSPDEQQLAVPTKQGIAIWEVPKGRKVGEWRPEKYDHVRSMQWSPDGTRLVATYIEMTGPSTPANAAAGAVPNAVHHCYLLDHTGSEIAKVVGNSPAFSPSGDRIATVYGRCNILDGRTGRRLTWISASPRESVLGSASMIFSPDGNWLLTNGSAAVYERRRSEWWYSVLTLPAYWGTIICFVLLVRELVSLSVKSSTDVATNASRLA